MTSTICRAKNPASCQYHGTGSASNTETLRNTMLVARDVMKVAQGAETFTAKYNLEEAETAYYGTEEGRTSLIASINTEANEQVRSYWTQLLQKADSKREFIESATAQVVKGKVALPFKRDLKVESDGNGRKSVLLAEGAYTNGTGYSFDWDQKSGLIFYGEDENEDSFKSLGKATNLTVAKRISEEWFNAQWARN